MIRPALAAMVQCDEEGCTASCEAQLALMVGGGFAFRPGAKDWQFAPGTNGVIVSLCPAHKKTLVKPPPGNPVRRRH